MSTDERGGIRRHFNYSNVMSTLAVFMVIAGGTALAAKVKSNSVKSSSVKDNTLVAKDLKDGAAVGAADVIDNSLTGADINESQLTLPASPNSLPPSGAAGGGLAGTYPNPTIANDAVGTANLQDNSVNSAKVSADSLAAGDLAPNSVGQSEIETDGVRAPELGTVITRVSAPNPIDAGANDTQAVSCLAGEQVLSGGVLGGTFDISVVTSQETGGDQWFVSVQNEGVAASSFQAQVLCLAA